MGIFFEVLKNFFKKPFTIRYPKERVEPPSSFRGKLKIQKKKCIGCGACKTVCPSRAIRLGIKIQKIKIKGILYKEITHPIISIDLGKCVFCGLCVNTCPKDVISFTHEFELASSNREKLFVR